MKKITIIFLALFFSANTNNAQNFITKENASQGTLLKEELGKAQNEKVNDFLNIRLDSSQYREAINTMESLKQANINWYNRHLFPSLISLFVAIISFFGAQAFFRWKENRKRKEKYISILKVILDEVKLNLDLVCQTYAYLYVEIIPSYDLSLFASKNLFSDLSAITTNYDLIRQIFRGYFEFSHIQNRTVSLRTIPAPNDMGGTRELAYMHIYGTYQLYIKLYKELKKEKAHLGIEELNEDYLKKKYEYFRNDELAVKNIPKEKNIDLDQMKKFHKS